MKQIIVLGAGMVGSAMAFDLANSHKVTLTDLCMAPLEAAKSKCTSLDIQTLDVTDHTLLTNTIQSFDMVICAVPGFLGFQTLKTIIKAGLDVVDISFFPENALDLDNLAKANGVTAIVDCGVAPGMGNVILGYYDTLLKLTDFECLVGGLPKYKKWPFNYKAPFSPIDVIEEYTRPARYVENGVTVVKEPLTDCEYVEFKGLGTLEAFNSDGLRSLIHTMPHIHNMKEKTLRYPGHVEYIKVLKQSGFFKTTPFKIKGQSISPLDFTSAILFKEWKLNSNEEELTVMRIKLKGKNNKGQVEQVVYELNDTFCQKTQISSMARTTGYTATAAANLLLDGLFEEKGIFPPELVGKYEHCFNYFISYLKNRGINYKKTVETLNVD